MENEFTVLKSWELMISGTALKPRRWSLKRIGDFVKMNRMKWNETVGKALYVDYPN